MVVVRILVHHARSLDFDGSRRTFSTFSCVRLSSVGLLQSTATATTRPCTCCRRGALVETAAQRSGNDNSSSSAATLRLLVCALSNGGAFIFWIDYSCFLLFVAADPTTEQENKIHTGTLLYVAPLVPVRTWSNCGRKCNDRLDFVISNKMYNICEQCDIQIMAKLENRLSFFIMYMFLDSDRGIFMTLKIRSHLVIIRAWCI